MNPKDIKEAIDFAADPNTRLAFVYGFTIALILGYSAGIISCKFLYMLARLIVAEIRNYFIRKERQREAERQRKEAAVKRRLESCERRKNEKRPLYGIPFDRSGTPHCPICGRPIHPFLKEGAKFKSACYACKQQFFCLTSTLPDEVSKLWN